MGCSKQVGVLVARITRTYTIFTSRCDGIAVRFGRVLAVAESLDAIVAGGNTASWRGAHKTEQ